MFPTFFKLIPAAVVVVALASCGSAAALTQQTASYTVNLSLDTLAVGDRTITVDVADQAGKPVEAQQVTLAPTMLSMGMASPEVSLRAEGNGRYSGQKMLLSMTGEWAIDVKITSNRGTETARFLMTVPTQ